MKNVLLIVFLLLTLAGSAFAMKTPQKMLLFWNNTDTTSYVYFGTVYLIDSDGAYITDSDGAYITF